MSLVIGREQRRHRLNRLLRQGAIAVGAIALGVLLCYSAFRRWTYMKPPADDGPPLPTTVRVESTEQGTRLVLGDNWIERRRGLWWFHLRGGPRIVGHSHGLLAHRLTSVIERQMLRWVERALPDAGQRWVELNAWRWRLRHLPATTPPRHLVELAAFSRNLADTADFPERPFQRLAYYHAMYDLLQSRDERLFDGGLAFAVWGGQTVGHRMLVGRSFTVGGTEVFDRNKAVLAVRIRGRLPFVSVAWPGMMGVVTGVNAKRLFVAVNAACTDEPTRAGTPTVFLAREILERAATLKEALRIVKETPAMTPQALLLADGKTSRALVVELSPRRALIRRAPAGLLAVTNHFLHKEFKSDASNDRVRRYTTSDWRYRRLKQLLRRFGGRIDVATAALVLRNRTAVDDEPLALGHARALDSLKATHGVVADLTDMRLWVSRGPHLLGPFVAIDLAPLLGMAAASKAPEDLPADALLEAPAYRRYQLARAQLLHARLLAERGQLAAAADFARRAAQGAPELPEVHKLSGDLAWRRQDRGAAKRHYRRFLELQPPYRADVEEVERRMVR